METGCVGMQVQHCAGQLFITITQYQRWSTYKQKVWCLLTVLKFPVHGHLVPCHWACGKATHRTRTKSFTASPGSKREWVPTSPSKDLPSTFKRHLTGPHFLKASSWDSPILTHAPRWTSRFVQLSGQTTVKWKDTFGTLAIRNITQKQPIWSHHWRSLLKETDYLYWHVTVLDTTKNSLSTRSP